MAASKAPHRNRTNPSDPASERTIEKIRTSQITNRLIKHILGQKEQGKVVKLNSSQVTAALGLLRKVMPDLAAVAATVEDNRMNVQVQVYRPAATEAEWMDDVSGETMQ